MKHFPLVLYSYHIVETPKLASQGPLSISLFCSGKLIGHFPVVYLTSWTRTMIMMGHILNCLCDEV